MLHHSPAGSTGGSWQAESGQQIIKKSAPHIRCHDSAIPAGSGGGAMWRNRMTTELRLSPAVRHDPGESLTLAQRQALERAVAKVVALGGQVGVSPDQMILLLRSGLTVGDLLACLAARPGEIA